MPLSAFLPTCVSVLAAAGCFAAPRVKPMSPNPWASGNIASSAVSGHTVLHYPEKHTMMKLTLAKSLGFMLVLFVMTSTTRAAFNLTLNITSPGSFTTPQLQMLEGALDDAEAMWEDVITGYQPGISIGGITISVTSFPDISGSGLADANVLTSVEQGGFRLSTTGRIRINPGVIDIFGSWDGSGPNPPNTEFLGVNYIDELMAHEIGHVLGIGIQWIGNGVYTNGTGRYTGQYGVAAYRDEFDAAATFLPVELAGSSGTQNSHWDQLMRSSSQEGNPSDPWSLDPRVGITDQFGRDFASELMTGAIDPDYGEPFLSNTTVQSLRDLGYTVVPEPSAMVLLTVGAALALLLARGCHANLSDGVSPTTSGRTA